MSTSLFSLSGGLRPPLQLPRSILLHSDSHAGNCPDEGDITGIGDGLSGSPATAAMAAAVVAIAAATETTGETAHDCHPTDVAHGAMLMGMSTRRNGYRSFLSLSGGLRPRLQPPRSILLHSDRHTGLAG